MFKTWATIGCKDGILVTSPKEIQMVFAAFAPCSSRKIILIASRDLPGGSGRFLILEVESYCGMKSK